MLCNGGDTLGVGGWVCVCVGGGEWLVQERRNSIANALELRLSYTNSWTYCQCGSLWWVVIRLALWLMKCIRSRKLIGSQEWSQCDTNGTGRLALVGWVQSQYKDCLNIKTVFPSSGQTILLNDRSDRSKPLRSIIDRKANLRSIICRFFIIVKWIRLLLWKQYIIITVRLGIWDNSHLL